MPLNALEKFNIINLYFQDEISLSTLAKKHSISVRTLQRWIAKYNNKGLNGLEKKIRTDMGKYRKLDDKIKDIIEGLFLQKQNVTIATITRKLKEYCLEQNIPPINYYKVRRVIKNIPNDLSTLAKYGDKVYENLYEIVMRREVSYPNEVWQVDHSLLSIEVLLDNGKKECPWLTIIIDDFSRAIMSFTLFTGAPSAIQTALALRNAIWYKQDNNWSVCGIPEKLYTDHGTDFTSTHINYVCADLKIQLIHSTIGKPKGRGKVERFFLNLEKNLLERLKLNNITYTLNELNSLIKSYIIDEYHNQIHSTTKESPLALWQKYQIIPQMPESIGKLNLLLLTAKKSRIVQRDGIRFANFRYFHPNLVAYIGECITIRFDPNDLGEIWIYDEQNRCICKAVCEDFQEQIITYEEVKKIRTNRKKQLKQEIKNKVFQVKQTIYDKEKQEVSVDKVVKSKFRLYQNE